MSASQIRRAVALVLTGQDLSLPDARRWSAKEMADDLAARGWGHDEIAAHLRSGSGPGQTGVDIGPAQLQAALTEMRQVLDLSGLPTPTVSSQRGLTAAERRLVEDTPPHYR